MNDRQLLLGREIAEKKSFLSYIKSLGDHDYIVNMFENEIKANEEELKNAMC